MKSLHLPPFFSNLVLVLALLGVWIAFAPVNLGGTTSYVIVNGISMEPDFHLGDLTIIRKASDYQIGDVVTYQDARMNAYVIHRIIDMQGDRFVLKGDNNSWVDVYYPTHEEIIGKLWLHIPNLGKLFEWLRAPLNLAMSISLLGGIGMSGMIIKPPKKGRAKSVRKSTGSPESGLYVFGLLTLVFLSLSVLAFLRPLTRSAEKIRLTQQGQFSYSATGTPILYDTEVVRSGEPIFPRLTCFLNIDFAYNLLASSISGAAGNYQITARVIEEQTGWQRTMPLSGVTAFQGNSFSTTAVLDLCQIITLVQTLEQETGLRAGRYMLEVFPQINMAANIAGLPISETFEPRLMFRFDDISFSLLTPDDQENPFISAQQRSFTNPATEANTVTILGLTLSIRTMRIIALAGLALSLGGTVLLGITTYTAARQNPDSLIRLRYGSLLVNAHGQDIQATGPVINVDSINELAKLAERHNTVILHTIFNSLHSYLVQCNGVTYRFVEKPKRLNTREIEPRQHEIVKPAYESNLNNLLAGAQEESELIGYILSKRTTQKAEVEETVIMRKIQL